MEPAWNEIKKHLVKGKRVGSFGYQRRINLGADIFMSIRESFKDEEAEIKVFNADIEVGEAILNRGFIERVTKECFEK